LLVGVNRDPGGRAFGFLPGESYTRLMAERRRTVTVVFTDVSGSTALGEQLDAEALRRVMERYFAEARRAFERHGGTVEKFIGDAVVAVFGIPAAHEDDALRAVRAAREIQEAVANLSADLEEGGVTFRLRTGINTGEVVAGDASGGQFYATGDAVNVAARLEQGASPGEIVLGETTYQLVRDKVEVEPLEQLTLKGKTQAVPAYRLLEIIERAPSLTRRFDTPFVGRTSELARLLQYCHGSVAEQVPTLVTVLGPAGIGKTRLAGELAAKTGQKATVLQGRCLAYGEGITFWPLQEILRSLPERPAGAPDPEEAQSTEETFWAYRKLFESLAHERPLLLVLEDIHWAEPTLLDLIEHVVEWTTDAPMSLVCLARPELLDERPDWPGERLELEPLSEDEAKKLVAALGGDLDPSIRERAMEASEGNPLFLEQLLAFAAEDRRDLTVPQTIQALLAARLDRLDAEERALLERAAIVGKEFWRGALVALSPPGTEVSALLQRLVRRRLVVPERSSLLGEDAFRFGHILIREATYGGIPKEARSGLHELFADWLEEEGAPYEEIVGYHLEQAYWYKRELALATGDAQALGARAGESLGAAGQAAFARNDLAAAINLLTRATALYEETSPRRLDLLVDLGAALFQMGEGQRALAVLDDALDGSRAVGEWTLEWRARLERNYVHGQVAGEDAISPKEELRQAEQAILALEDLGDDRALAKAWRMVTQTHFWLGRNQISLEASERALEYARRAGDRHEEVRVLRVRGMALWSGPTPAAEAAQGCEQIVAEAWTQEIAASALENLGALRAMQGELDEARRLIDRARAIYEELGLTYRFAVNLAIYSAGLHTLMEDHDGAEHDLRRAIVLLESIGEQSARSTFIALLAGTLYWLGRYAEAERHADLAEEMTSIGDQETLRQVWSVRAMVLARQGDFEQAMGAVDEAVRFAEKTDDLEGRAYIWMDKAEVLQLAGDPQGAVSCLERAIGLLERKGNVVAAQTARSLIAEIRPAART
jgi:class 3 adenylate cyclase/tetratricopeptide (TPR) repeat protein